MPVNEEGKNVSCHILHEISHIKSVNALKDSADKVPAMVKKVNDIATILYSIL